jgi:hypothetical protein
MEDPSFILRGSAARDLGELARDLQALLDARAAALVRPVSAPDIDLMTPAPAHQERSALALDDGAKPPPGQRAGAGSASILPYLAQSLASKPLGQSGAAPDESGGV